MLETQPVRHASPPPAMLATPEECHFECLFACDFDCAGASTEIQRNMEGVLQVTRVCFCVGNADDPVSPAS